MLTLEERSMIPVINRNHADLVKRTFGHAWSSPTALDEIDAGYGIADVVIFNRDSFSQADSQRDLFFGREDQIRTLFVVNEHKTFSITDLSDKLPFSKPKLKNHLSFLEEAGFIRTLDADVYEVVNQYGSGLGDNIAIEAKIKDWRRGLYQAYRYKWFSNASYLAVHHKFIGAPMAHLEEFERLNVGLIEVRDDELAIVYQPEVAPPKSSIINALANERVLERCRYN